MSVPEIVSTVTTSWKDGATLWASVTTSWRDGATLWASPSGYTMPDPPPGSTPTEPVPMAPLYVIPAQQSYSITHTMSAVDLRGPAALPLLSATISTDEDSTVWVLRAEVAGTAFASLTSGVQPVTLEVTVAGQAWTFVVDSVSRQRSSGGSTVSVSGRSLTAAAGDPFQPSQNWVTTGAVNAAQLCAMANLYTGVTVQWEVEDWVIPENVFSFAGTPMALVKRVAEAVGAVVRSHRSDPVLIVAPKYPTMPNEWPVDPPTVRIAFEALETESFSRADKPGYNGVYLSGQQSGAYGYVRLAGTSGAVIHPFVTDLLLTDLPAITERGRSILGASGEQALQVVTLPVLTGGQAPGVLECGWVCEVPDPDGTWYGIVRAVALTASHGQARQSVTLERHTALLEGTTIT